MPFKAEIVEGVDNEIMVAFPAMDYNHYMNVDCFPDQFVSPKAKQQMDYCANNFNDKGKDLRLRYVVFKILPRADLKHPKVSVRGIFVNTELGKELELETKVFALKSKHSQMKKKLISWYVQWTFVVKDGEKERPRKIGKPKNISKMSMAARMMAEQMSAYDSDDSIIPDAKASS
ncbi:hypothetical protein IV203_009804 [Nitzschia inconspicua]|uniref:Uncharacterized protein n=1 Tax=Nitzschia inconspicua TaxID=303405 RepID=A0A9K3PMH9_9STRA|nr:hypothetical protein IV203_009804 [Nitzschia inconspicua]